MADLIDRQAAIMAIKEDKIDLTNPNVVAVFKATGDFEKVETQVMTCDRHIKILKDLQSAQPYTDEEIQKMQDIEQAQFYKIHDLAYQEGKADAMRWISCADRLPEYGEAVLTINDDEDYEINHIIDEDTGEWFYEGAIAWMPLPKPPKER